MTDANGQSNQWSWYHEDVVPDWPAGLRLSYLALSGLIVLWSYAVGRRDVEAGFMLVSAVAVLIAPISWSFYPVWLLPSMIWSRAASSDVPGAGWRCWQCSIRAWRSCRCTSPT